MQILFFYMLIPLIYILFQPLWSRQIILKQMMHFQTAIVLWNCGFFQPKISLKKKKKATCMTLEANPDKSQGYVFMTIIF